MRRLAYVAATASILVVTGCGTATSSSGPSSPSEPTGSTDTAPVPDDELSDAQLTALLRSRATGAATSETCTPDQVEVKLQGFDVAAGHRYSGLVLRNTSKKTCTVEGMPGIGARGTDGHRLRTRVKNGLTNSTHRGPVTLAPESAAVSTIEWTGELAGAGQERASVLVVQMAVGQAPLPVPARIPGDAPGDPTIDIGMRTTVKLSRWVPLGG